VVTRTERGADLKETGRFNEDALEARIPLGRQASPSEIANVAALLASPEASHVTGQTWDVDGEWTIRGTI
jgi:NAD(P)-dependent dehydrogenase (short-subunit alcohol dehydrogenase family)